MMVKNHEQKPHWPGSTANLCRFSSRKEGVGVENMG
jgi:hypothetical protein